MPVDYGFIAEVSDKFSAYCEKNSLCQARDMKPRNANYAVLDYQIVYALRYLPAYYVEYCHMVEALRARINGRGYQSLNVVSLGCGLCQDYFALNDCLGLPFNYYGYDALPWEAIKLMPEVGANFNRCILSAGAIRKVNIDNVNVFIFPKSISDIHDSGDLKTLARTIASTNMNEIFFLNSYVRDPDHPHGVMWFFNDVKWALERQGFREVDRTGHQEICDGKISSVHADFDDYIAAVECDEQPVVAGADCENCLATQDPISAGNWSSYELIEFRR